MGAAPLPGSPPYRPAPFLASFLLHVGVLASLSFWTGPNPSQQQPPRNELQAPRKILLTFRRLEPLPKVSPPKHISRAEVSKGTHLTTHQAVITNARARKANQFNWTPPPAVKREVTASSDLVRVPLPAPSVPAPPAARTPKRFVAPVATRTQTQAKSILMASPSDLPDVKPLATAFKSSAVFSNNNPAVPKPVRQIEGAEAPPDLVGNDPKVANAIVILNASPSALPPSADPSATRNGQIARAGQLGSPAIRSSAEDGLRIPGVAIDRIGTTSTVVEPGKIPPDAKPKPVREIVYQKSLLGAAENSVSVPLRPRVRSIPLDIEREFAGRNVYTMLIPMASNPEYVGDWVIWFGERGTSTGEGRVMAPLPRVKKVMVLPHGKVEEGRIRAHVILERDGSVSQVVVLASSNPALRTRAAADLKEWEFRPAQKSGTAFAADLILDMTMRCAVEVE